MNDTIRLRFVRECLVNGDRFNVNDVADLPTNEARQLIGLHRAERCELTDEEIEAQAQTAEDEAAALKAAEESTAAEAEAAAAAKAGKK